MGSAVRLDCACVQTVGIGLGLLRLEWISFCTQPVWAVSSGFNGGKLRKKLCKFLATRGHISGKYERPNHVKPRHTSINSLEEPALVPCFDELPSPSAGLNVNDAVCALDLWALGLRGVCGLKVRGSVLNLEPLFRIHEYP